MEEMFHITPKIFEDNYKASQSLIEIGEESCPDKAFLFKTGSVTLVSGKSSSLLDQGYIPFIESHFNIEQALAVTKALSTLHAISVVESLKNIHPETEVATVPSTIHEGEQEKVQSNRKGSFGTYISLSQTENHGNSIIPDPLTTLISRPQILESNLSILIDNLKYEEIPAQVLDRLKAVKADVNTLTQFVQFAAVMQTSNRLPSVGPICMSDIWFPRNSNTEEIIIRLRGGTSLRAPPLRDVAWIWLTLMKPNILSERYIELCQAYCTSFNECIKILDYSHKVDELNVFDIMKDLGENFLHGFLTIVHKFVVSGTWTLDRKLYQRQGIIDLSHSISFLVDNGIVGPVFIA